MTKLILTRHGQSVWNAENRFTGWVDVDLSDKGREALSPDNKDAFTIPDLGELLSDIDEQNLSDEQKQLQKEKVYKLHSERSSKIHYLSQLLKA